MDTISTAMEIMAQDVQSVTLCGVECVVIPGQVWGDFESTIEKVVK